MAVNNTNKQTNMAVSAALNIIRKFCMVVFPLITYSYASRVLGTKGIGIHEFSQSIVSYFALIAALGVTQYAVRDGGTLLQHHKEGIDGEIDARARTNRTALDDFASEVFSINLCMTAVSYVLMAICLIFVPFLKGYGTAIWIASSLILFTTLGVDWINSLFEDYLYLTLRYIAVSVIALVLLFVLVREPGDVYYYIFIANFATIANGILNFVYIRRHVKLRFTFNLNLAKHGLPIFTLFCNNISSVIYLNSDVTILGILTSDEEVGLYGMAAKIYTMLKELINAAIFVTIPRFSMYVSSGQKDTYEKYINGLKKLLIPLISLLIPASVGLGFMAKNVIYIVAGEDFIKGGTSLSILAVALTFAVLACFVAYGIVLPNKMEKYFLVATTIAALVNIIFNFVLIPRLGINAAAITTLVAEIIVFAMLIVVGNKRVKVSELLSVKDFIITIVGTILVALVCIISKIITDSISVIATFVTVLIAVFVYILVLMVCKHSIVSYIPRRKKLD